MFLFVITKLELLAVINLLVEPFKREKQSTSALRDEKWTQRNESPPISFHRPAHPSSQSLSSSSKSFRSSGLMMAGREGLSTGLRMGWEDSRRGARTKRFSFFTSPLNHRLWKHKWSTEQRQPQRKANVHTNEAHLLDNIWLDKILSENWFVVKSRWGCNSGGDIISTCSFACLLWAHLHTEHNNI